MFNDERYNMQVIYLHGKGYKPDKIVETMRSELRRPVDLRKVQAVLADFQKWREHLAHEREVSRANCERLQRKQSEIDAAMAQRREDAKAGRLLSGRERMRQRIERFGRTLRQTATGPGQAKSAAIKYPPPTNIA